MNFSAIIIITVFLLNNLKKKRNEQILMTRLLDTVTETSCVFEIKTVHALF